MRILLFFLGISSFVYGQHIDSLIIELQQKADSLDYQKSVLNQRMEVLKLQWIRDEMYEIGLPKADKEETIIEHTAMFLSYNESHEQANWVMHVILPDIVNGNFSRSNDFREDTLVVTGSAQEKDYFLKTLKPNGEDYSYDGFGYDRGHLAPSADFRWSSKALSESYYYSNMSPQLGDFNREKWAELENWLRTYVEKYEVSLIVVTAPVLHDGLDKIPRSPNGLSIPKMYIKAALDLENNRAIGFVMPNEKLSLPVEAYVVSIDSIEVLLGYDLFSGLENPLEEEIESQEEYNYWLPKDQAGDVQAIDQKRLPKKAFSTYSIHLLVDDGKKHTVCGKVVSTKKTEKGHVFMDLDKKFPNQIFSISIFESSISNFDYEPEVYLMDKEVCVTSKIGEYNDTPNMVLENGKQVKLLGEY